MKKSLVYVPMIALLLLAGTTYAQSAWPVSKGVNKYSNKELSSQELAASHLTATSVNTPLVASSKGVSRVSKRMPYASQSSNVASNGTPSWVVSKGVARFSTKQASTVEHGAPSDHKEIKIEHKETRQ